VAPNIGIDRLYDAEDYAEGREIGMGLGDYPFLRQTARKLDRLPEPFFAHVITLTSHHPYKLPSSHLRLRLGKLGETYFGRYLHSVHYTDIAIGAFIRHLRRTGLLDRSVLIVLGDHDMGRLSGSGEVVHIMDSSADASYLPKIPLGARRHMGGDDPLTRMDWLRRVPLLIRFPGGANAATIDTPTSQIQLPSTILSLLGLPTVGRDFLSGPMSIAKGNDALIAFRDGSGFMGDKVYINADREGEDDGCWQLSSQSRLNNEDCSAMASEIAIELSVSDTVIIHGLSRPSSQVQP
jgi:phosphoglycerol transferase MdoB-like AlkP superfamily enzyme